MGFPREYLDFTTWYLRSKGYLKREDNSDFSLTVLGVDFVEENHERFPLLSKLLGSGRPQEYGSNGWANPVRPNGTVLTALIQANHVNGAGAGTFEEAPADRE
jgi:hypothetical protein